MDGNITQIVDGNGKITSYVYDDLGQLVRENIEAQNKTYVYTYDNGGNRTSKKTYAYTTANSLSSLTYTEETYTYGNASWSDQLTQIKTNDVVTAEFAYDAIGNPTTYNGYDLTWDGRQLKKMQKSGLVMEFRYNADGIRTSKTIGGIEHVYTLNGTQIVSEAWGDYLLIYLYDESGSPIGMQYRETSYAADVYDTFYFEKNLQGDIIAVYNESGLKIVSYNYDAWGNHTPTWHNLSGSNILAAYNPFRYRGYYYDTDTGLYYLQSRYYNPTTGRFINADVYVNANGDLIGHNMYAYCSNNPIRFVDPCGYSIIDWFWNLLYGNPDKQEETRHKLEYIKDSIARDISDIWDCVTWDIGVGFGFGGSLSAEYYTGTAMLRFDIITTQKRTGENPMLGMASDVYSSVEVGKIFNVGKGTRELWKFSIEKGMEPIYQETINGSLDGIHLEGGVAIYFLIGATCKVGFDATEYINRKYSQYKEPDPYDPWKK